MENTAAGLSGILTRFPFNSEYEVGNLKRCKFSITLIISKRFNAIDESGFGYFYGGQTRERNNPEHPIIEKIKSGKTDVGLIIPKGSSDRNFWLPEKLKQ